MVALARRAFGTRRVGHAGTLDPFATGVLLLLVGRATRLAPFLVGLPKSYGGVLRLGETTNTDDATGTVLAASDAWHAISDTAVADAMTALTGSYEQMPPQFSAKKVGGDVAHRRARRGVPLMLTPQPVTIRQFRCVSRSGADVTFEADVSSGTYVRALARDLGERLGCGAHVRQLRRTAVGGFRIDDAASAEALQAGDARPRPMLEAVGHLARVMIDDAAYERLRHGQAVAWPGQEHGPVAVVLGEALVAVASRSGERLEPKVVLEG